MPTKFLRDQPVISPDILLTLATNLLRNIGNKQKYPLKYELGHFLLENWDFKGR